MHKVKLTLSVSFAAEVAAVHRGSRSNKSQSATQQDRRCVSFQHTH